MSYIEKCVLLTGGLEVSFSIQTDKFHSSTGHLYAVALFQSFEHVHNLPINKTRQNGYHLIQNTFTA